MIWNTYISKMFYFKATYILVDFIITDLPPMLPLFKRACLFEIWIMLHTIFWLNLNLKELYDYDFQSWFVKTCNFKQVCLVTRQRV